MKIFSSSNEKILFKKLFLIFLIFSSYVIDANCKTKKKLNSASLANRNKTTKKNFRKKHKFFSKKNTFEKRYKHNKSLDNRLRRQGKDDDQELKTNSIVDIVKQALAIKIINMNKNQLEKPKDGCLRLYNEPNFKSTNFKELCTETQFAEIANVKKPSSILVADDIKLIFYRNDHDTAYKNFKIIYNESKEIRNYPFIQDNIFEKFKNIFVVKQGYVFLSEKTLFQGNFKLTNTNMTNNKLGFSTIESILLGKNTFLNITVQGGKNIKITNDTFRNSFKKVEKIEIIVQDDIVIPKIDPDCIMIFQEPKFSNSDNQTPHSFCAETGETNGIAKIPLAKIINDAEKSTKSANLDNFEETLRLGIGSILVGSRVTAVAFQKPYLEGNAFLVNEMLLSSDHSEFEDKIKSLYILEPGCYIFFEDQNFEDKKGGDDILRLCSSINSYPKANWGHHDAGSLILGKNTVLEIYEKENYQGKVTIISNSLRILSVELFHQIGSIKIVKPTSNEIDLLSANFNNNGCLLIYDQENFQGYSKLLCDNNHMNPNSNYKKPIKSFKMTSGNRMIIQYNSVDTLLSYDRKVYADKSFEIIPNNKNAKFNRFDVLKETCIMLFEECNYQGEFIVVCEDISDLSQESITSNSFKSILVGQKAVVLFHNLINFTSKVGTKPYKLNESISCIKDKKVKKVFEDIASLEFEMSNNPQKNSEIPDTGYSVFNLILGIILGLFDEDFKEKNSAESSRNTILKCIPDKFKKEIHSNEKNEVETSVIEYKDGSDSFFMKILNGGGRVLKKIVEWFCNFKEKMFKYISYVSELMGWMPKKENKEDEGWLKKIEDKLDLLADHEDTLEDVINNADEKIPKLHKEKLYQPNPRQKIILTKRLSPTKRKFRVRYTGIVTKFFEYLVRFKNWIVENAKHIFRNYIIKAFSKVKNFFLKFIAKIEAFFKKPAVLAAIEAIACAAYGIANIYSKIKALITNIKVVILGISSISGGGLGILILIEFMLSQLCNLKYFKLALNYYYLGNKIIETDRPLAFSYYGLAIGTTLNSIANAESFTSKLKNLFKDNEEIDYDSIKKTLDNIKNWVYAGKN